MNARVAWRAVWVHRRRSVGLVSQVCDIVEHGYAFS
jgi:hypothetical protein